MVQDSSFPYTDPRTAPNITCNIKVIIGAIIPIFSPKSPAPAYRHYAKGDVICRPGQTIDGLYSVISGAMESRIPNHEGPDDFVRILGPGDHWGERSLANDTLAKGTLTAIEDMVVLVLRRADFVSLSTAFPPLQEYFDNISDETYAPSLRSASKNRSAN